MPYGVEVAYEADTPKDDGTSRLLRSSLFAANSKLGMKKSLTVKKTDNFSLALSQRLSGDAESDLLSIAELDLKGLNVSSLNLTDADIANSTVNCILEADESGMVQLNEAVFLPPEVKSQESMTDRIKNLFGSSKNKENETAANSNETVVDAEMQKALEKLLKTPQRINLKIETSDRQALFMSKAEKASARSR